MATIQILVGAPCSGKSTYANEELAKNAAAVRIGRDGLRYMLRNEGICLRSMEGHITELQDLLITHFLGHNYDIILDNTHCKYDFIQEVNNKYGAKARITTVLFKEPKWKLKWRNIIRYLKKRIWIPPKVIDVMCKNCKQTQEKIRGNNTMTLIKD